jgi:hypothetical protein
MFEFLPKKEFREFNAKSLIGKIVELQLQHLSDDKKKQYVCTSNPCYVSGWVNTLGEPDTKVKRKIVDAYIMEHCNGGRSDYDHYDSWKHYFNKNKKKEVQEFWKAGLLGKIGRGLGDLDRIELIVVFKEFQLEATMYDYEAPEEWYSEMYANDEKFSFKRGFYETSDEAIRFFTDKPHDDLFGERYFPVVVFPKDTKANVRNIVYGAKSHSKPIVTKDYIVFGTRCKPYEYSSIISETYNSGGKVARCIEWDWD